MTSPFPDLEQEEVIGLTRLNLNIHVMLMDINLTGNYCDGINASLYIRETTDTKVVMLTAYSDKELITNSFSAGASNYIAKENYKEIPAAIRSALLGTSPIDVMLEDYRMMRENSLLGLLSRSEQEVLSLAKDGLARIQIKQQLCKSENILKTQISSILKKFHVGSLNDAIFRIKHRGIHVSE